MSDTKKPRSMTPKGFLAKTNTKAANSAKAFLDQYREWLTTGELKHGPKIKGVMTVKTGWFAHLNSAQLNRPSRPASGTSAADPLATPFAPTPNVGVNLHRATSDGDWRWRGARRRRRRQACIRRPTA